MKKAVFLSLSELDIVKSGIMCVLSAILTSIYMLLQTGVVIGKTQIVVVFVSGLTAGLGYLIKNLFTNSKDEVFTPEPIMPPREVLEPLGLDTPQE